MAEPLAVDATPLISAILGSRAREIIYSERFEFHSPQPTLFEVPKHIRWLASELEKSELTLYEGFQLFPITACQPADYDHEMDRATELIGHRDPLDIPLLALALARDYPIWSDDRDFEGIAEIRLLKTADLLLQLANR